MFLFVFQHINRLRFAKKRLLPWENTPKISWVDSGLRDHRQCRASWKTTYNRDGKVPRTYRGRQLTFQRANRLPDVGRRPMASTSPTTSWPGTIGNIGSGSSPSTTCKSVRHTTQAWTRIRICPGPGSGTARVLARGPSPARSSTMVVIVSLIPLPWFAPRATELDPQRATRPRN